jgi:aminoglycoside N3'-acetyltransferase
MTTLTLKINEKSKAGKAILSLVNLISAENKGVEICDTPNFDTIKAMYEAEHKIKLNKVANSKTLFESLGI